MAHQMVNGADLFYEDVGRGEPILMHHGYTGSHDVWLDLVVPRLRDSYRCIVMDARGAGESSHPEDGYTLEQCALDVLGMADALGLERFTYVGHSMGGAIGLLLGLEHPQRLDRLVLVAPIPSGGSETASDMRAHARAQRHAPEGRAQMLRERLALRLRASEELIERAVDRSRSVSEGHFERSNEAMATFNVTDRLGTLATPTLMVAGAADGLCTANVMDWMRLPNATLHVFSRVGHSIPSDVPGELADVIADFMEHGVVNAQTQQQRLMAVTASAPVS